VTEEDAIEQIDIGGVTLLRAAAKNHRYVLVVSDPTDYPKLIHGKDVIVEIFSLINFQTHTALKFSNGIPLVERKKLALKAFQHTCTYDSAISSWLGGTSNHFDDVISLCAKKTQTLRYGENPHQQGM
jgi:phosphoribosylaminoimidazolecarboxamide formyltransferase / IMP cyclohydrolase